MKQSIAYFIVVLILFSCGKSRQVVQLNDKTSARYTEMFHEGIRYKQKKQNQNAIHVFEACAELNQFDDAPYFVLSELYSTIGDKENAISNLELASKRDNKNQWYKEALAEKYLQSANYKKAIEFYKDLLKINPQQAEWLFALTECYFKNGQMKESFQNMERLEKVIGTNPEIIIEKYRLMYFQKKIVKGEEILLNGLKEFPDNPDILAILVDFYFDNKQDKKALELLFRLGEVDPSNGNVHLSLAQHYIQHNDLPNTFKELKLAYACPEIPLENKTRFTMYFFDTQAKLSKEVLELGTILTEQYPNEAKVHTLLGDLYMKDDNEVLALASFKKAIELDPSKYSIWEQVMVMEYEFQQFENLYNDGIKAVELFPSSSKIHLLTGTAANQIKKYKEAIDILSVGKELTINNPEIKAEFYAQIGQANFKLKQITEAKRNYDEAIALAPSNKLNLNNYAYYLANEKTDLETAEKYIKEVLEVKPNDFHYLDTYGWVLFQKGAYKEALAILNQAHQSNQNEPLITEHLGDVQFKLGNVNEALIYWKKALELGAKNSILQKKIDKKHYYEPTF
jgi:tetratricopeptide (TPR) repeat protein